jgi:uncharacterized repeat protein (TIGR01451 family)
MRRVLFPAAVLIFPMLVAAHPVVDLAVSMSAPQFAAEGASITYIVRVSDLAYDTATGILLTDTLPAGARFTSASGSGWNCSESKGVVTCAAETLTPGISKVTINAIAPSRTGMATNKAALTSLATIDPNPENDTSSVDTIVYAAAACKANAPIITGTQWTAVDSATRYRVWTAVEGAKPYVLAETTGTELAATFEPGRNEWWVDAQFNACPPSSSTHVQTISDAPPRPAFLETVATFDAPVSIGFDSYGNLFIADAAQSAIDRIDAKGNVALIAGTPGIAGNVDAAGPSARLDHPLALAVAPGGYTFIADTGNGSVRILYPGGDGVFFGPFLGTVLRGLSRPSGIAITPSYMIYVSDGHEVRKIDVSGALLEVFGPYDAPAGVAIDEAGTLYVIDGDSIRVDGRTITGFHQPAAITFDPLGNLYVADTGANAVRRIAPSGFVTTVIDHGLNAPAGLAFDGAGSLFIADRDGRAVKVMTTTAPPDRRRAVAR